MPFPAIPQWIESQIVDVFARIIQEKTGSSSENFDTLNQVRDAVTDIQVACESGSLPLRSDGRPGFLYNYRVNRWIKKRIQKDSRHYYVMMLDAVRKKDGY